MSSDEATTPEGGSPNLGRDLSARVVMFHQSVADRVGLNLSDLKALDILARSGPLSAGQLAVATGLTTGSITAMVDRLEDAGFVRREPDPADRRRVLIRPLDERIEQEIGQYFAPLARRMMELVQRFSPEELAVITEFFQGSIEILEEETTRVREAIPR